MPVRRTLIALFAATAATGTWAWPGRKSPRQERRRQAEAEAARQGSSSGPAAAKPNHREAPAGKAPAEGGVRDQLRPEAAQQAREAGRATGGLVTNQRDVKSEEVSRQHTPMPPKSEGGTPHKGRSPY